MGLRIKNFVIQAKIKEQQSSIPENSSIDSQSVDALKAEIIDECIEKVKELISREKSRV